MEIVLSGNLNENSIEAIQPGVVFEFNSHYFIRIPTLSMAIDLDGTEYNTVLAVSLQDGCILHNTNGAEMRDALICSKAKLFPNGN